MTKTRINISLDQDLADFVRLFAIENRTSVADVITQYLLALKRRSAGENSEQILSHPAFKKAMKDAQTKLRNGKANWHSYDEVFGD